LPKSLNYIGVFLTFRCNLNCSYCINKFGEFKSDVKELSADDWIRGLSRIETRDDLPITLQGGEPTLHPSFYQIVRELHENGKYLDLLTNGLFDIREFCKEIGSEIFKRKAKYASIRFSFHEKTNPTALALKVWKMQNMNYGVGIWGFDYSSIINRKNEMQHLCKWLNIDFRLKEYFGWIQRKLWGTYKYPDACLGKARKKVLCKTSELLINPAGHIFRCHADLYANRNPTGHILDKEVKFPDFLKCDNFGHCNPCDVHGPKFDRFQKSGHCSVAIKELNG